jgi:F-type H+-transporting ATPase subunit b
MRFDWWTLGLQTVNFAVLVWLLHQLLYRPVLRMIDARRAEMEKQYAAAAAATAKASEQLAEMEAERSHIAAEREAVLKAATAQAEEAAKARRAQAENEAAAFLESMRKTIADERGRAFADARNLAVDFGAEVAHRLLADTPRGEAWLEKIERHLASLPKAEKEALIRQLENGASLTVVTASSLAPETAETWRVHLRRSLGDGTSVAFDVDPDLLAGVELHFPSAILRFSWQSALASVRSELEAS